MPADDSKFISVKIWDLPIRVFHWLLVILVIIMFASAKTGNFDIHILAGKFVTGLLVARICWGILGSSNTRFSSLLFRPQQIFSYIARLPKRKPSYQTGHSPIGSLAVILILVALLVQASTGLIAADVDGLVEGPFAYYVTYELSRWASDIHVQHEQWVLILIIVHLLANAFYYFYKKDNLIHPMISGSKSVPQHLSVSRPELATTRRGAVVAIVVAILAVWVFSVYG